MSSKPLDRLKRHALVAAHRARDLGASVHWWPEWVRAEGNTGPSEPIADVPLFAVLGTFNEADIIEAAVANAFYQGVQRVYLVDNASTDDTVELAVRQGAILAESYDTPSFDEDMRILLMNATVLRISLAEDIPHIWWFWMDADEFSHGPGEQTIGQYLAGLDRRFRVVGADMYRHLPDRKPENIPGFHPLDFQPMCTPFWQPPIPRCRIRHYKHPLQRFDREGPFLSATSGFHKCSTHDEKVRLTEPTNGIVTHHFQYRTEEFTRHRMEKVYGHGSARIRNATYKSGGHKRLDSLDAVYSQQWLEVENQMSIRGNKGVTLSPWNEFSKKGPGRWYDQATLEQARQSWLDENS
jgi:glycosyltransferase involved in cell wall biosynthesis